MAVTVTLGRLANEVRVSTTANTSDVPAHYVNVLTTNLAAATALVEARAPDAPEDSQNKAVIQLVGYWLEAPPSAPQRFGYNGLCTLMPHPQAILVQVDDFWFRGRF